MEKVVILCLILTATTAMISHSKYDVVTKDYCLEEREIFLDRGLVFNLQQDFMNGFPGSPVSFDCHMQVRIRTRSSGIISIIEQMNLRKGEGYCIDRIQFYYGNPQIYNYPKGKLCGEMKVGEVFQDNRIVRNYPEFISEFVGPFERSSTYSPHLLPPGANVESSSSVNVYVHVDKVHLPPGGRLALSLTFTGYTECDGLNVPKGMFNCGFGVCILEMFVGDGIVNCPFGDCRDEGDCHNALGGLEIVYDGNETTPMSNRQFLLTPGYGRN